MSGLKPSVPKPRICLECKHSRISASERWPVMIGATTASPPLYPNLEAMFCAIGEEREPSTTCFVTGQVTSGEVMRHRCSTVNTKGLCTDWEPREDTS